MSLTNIPSTFTSAPNIDSPRFGLRPAHRRTNVSGFREAAQRIMDDLSIWSPNRLCAAQERGQAYDRKTRAAQTRLEARLARPRDKFYLNQKASELEASQIFHLENADNKEYRADIYGEPSIAAGLREVSDLTNIDTRIPRRERAFQGGHPPGYGVRMAPIDEEGVYTSTSTPFTNRRHSHPYTPPPPKTEFSRGDFDTLSEVHAFEGWKAFDRRKSSRATQGNVTSGIRIKTGSNGQWVDIEDLHQSGRTHSRPFRQAAPTHYQTPVSKTPQAPPPDSYQTFTPPVYPQLRKTRESRPNLHNDYRNWEDIPAVKGEINVDGKKVILRHPDPYTATGYRNLVFKFKKRLAKNLYLQETSRGTVKFVGRFSGENEVCADSQAYQKDENQKNLTARKAREWGFDVRPYLSEPRISREGSSGRRVEICNKKGQLLGKVVFANPVINCHFSLYEGQDYNIYLSADPKRSNVLSQSMPVLTSDRRKVSLTMAEEMGVKVQKF